METINTFQQFFRVQSPPPPALFAPNHRIKTLTPSKSRSQQREVQQAETPIYTALKEVKRKSYSFIRKPDTITPRIFVRFRPLNQQEWLCPGVQPIQYQDDNTVIVARQPFKLDRVFTPSDSQEIVYESVAQQTLQDIVNGINGTIIAYGQTGSGKTHTMLGSPKHQGIIFRAICEILRSEQKVNISLFEVYKESINDLLNGLKDLKLKEDPTLGVYVERLSKVTVEDESQLKELIQFAEDNRHVAETKFNSSSSRSHLILTVQLNNGVKLNLVDLAGSEKVAKTGAKGETLEEAKKINSSLSCLGHVVQSLSQGLEHIPYRDSKLTRILQDSLQGNCRTSLIVTCSPHSISLEETISSLKFAQRAKLMKPQFKGHIEKRSYKDLEGEVGLLKDELLCTRLQLFQAMGNQSTQVDTLEETPIMPSAKNTKNTSSPSGWKSPIRYQFEETTPPLDTESNISTQRLVCMLEKVREDTTIEQQMFEVQRQLSYFLSGFSSFVKDLAFCGQTKLLTGQLSELNQCFQRLSMMVRQEEQKYVSQQRCFEEYKKSTDSLKGILTAASHDLNFSSDPRGSLQSTIRVDRILSQANISDFKSNKSHTDQPTTKIHQIMLRTEEPESHQKHSSLASNQSSVPPQPHHSTPLPREVENEDPCVTVRAALPNKKQRGVSQQKYLKTSETRVQGLLNKLKKI